jgi:hypothetical protein
VATDRRRRSLLNKAPRYAGGSTQTLIALVRRNIARPTTNKRAEIFLRLTDLIPACAVGSRQTATERLTCAAEVADFL